MVFFTASIIARTLSESTIAAITIAVISVVATFITAFFAFRGKSIDFQGKKVDAGEWLTNELREDAQIKRKELSDMEQEFRVYKKVSQEEIVNLRHDISQLQARETELVSYIKILEKEINVLKELFILQVGSTPNLEVTLHDFNLTKLDYPAE